MFHQNSLKDLILYVPIKKFHIYFWKWNCSRSCSFARQSICVFHNLKFTFQNFWNRRSIQSCTKLSIYQLTSSSCNFMVFAPAYFISLIFLWIFNCFFVVIWPKMLTYNIFQQNLEKITFFGFLSNVFDINQKVKQINLKFKKFFVKLKMSDFMDTQYRFHMEQNRDMTFSWI